VGFKWSLTAFCKHLAQVGIDMDLMWSRIYDVILKALICGENHVMQQLKKNNVHRNNCFEIFGYDILLDSDLKPWLVEINLSPALATDSPLDLKIKGNLLTDVFNLAGLKRFDRKKESINKMKNRMKNNTGMRTGMGRQNSTAKTAVQQQ
jgi:tubulin polyglutamylase TTLL5